MGMKVSITESGAELGRSFAFAFTTAADKIDLAAVSGTFEGDITVEGTILNTGRVYRLEGVIRCKKSFTCDRCLGHFVEPQEHAFAEDFQQSGTDDEADSEVNLFDGDVIDLTELVRDTILAAQPLRNLCRPDCRGLCPKCGADLNQGDCGCDRFVVDPRLAALQDLLKK